MKLFKKYRSLYMYNSVLTDINRLMVGSVKLMKANDFVQQPNAKKCKRRGYVAKYNGMEFHIIAYYHQPVIVKGGIIAAATLLKINGFELTDALFEYEANNTDKPIRGNYTIRLT